MVQLYSLTLAYMVGCAAAQNTALFSDECCSKKNVGGVAYTQVPGNTTGFPTCKPGCVYERDDSRNSRFCFRTGQKPFMCTESTSSAQVVFVTRKNGKLSFESPSLSHSCDIGSPPTDSEKYKEITCTHTVGYEHQTSETAETATLISSLSSYGTLEWISLHTDDEWIHCSFLDMSCHFTFLLGYKNTLFVEGAFPIQKQGAPLSEQLTECRNDCENKKDTCNFWTFSYHQDRTTTPSTHSHPRNHDDLSECGLRSYDACCLVETNADQWFGIIKDFPNLPPAPYTIAGYVAVWKVIKNISNWECLLKCFFDTDCTTWTWEFDQNKCSLNNYKPTRKIDIGYARPEPNLYSGCFDRKGVNCNALP